MKFKPTKNLLFFIENPALKFQLFFLKKKSNLQFCLIEVNNNVRIDILIDTPILSICFDKRFDIEKENFFLKNSSK